MTSSEPGDHFADRLRRRERIIGYWMMSDNPMAVERIARTGYDYVCVDGQHGLLDYHGWLTSMTALDTSGSAAAGVIRVPSNDPASIGRALDTGARGIIVPLVNNAEEAEAAVRACRYPPLGVRSYGPMRSALRVGPVPSEADRQVACVVMVETSEALANVDRICATAGLDAIYVGPSDLTLALGGDRPGDPAVANRLADSVSTVVSSAERAGIACGMHCSDGGTAARRLAEGFTFVSISNDLSHLERVASEHLQTARNL